MCFTYKFINDLSIYPISIKVFSVLSLKLMNSFFTNYIDHPLKVIISPLHMFNAIFINDILRILSRCIYPIYPSWNILRSLVNRWLSITQSYRGAIRIEWILINAREKHFRKCLSRFSF